MHSHTSFALLVYKIPKVLTYDMPFYH